VSKRRDAAYVSGMSKNWRKTKTEAWRKANTERWRMFEGGFALAPRLLPR
jgi:hypothetical protein